MDLNLFDAHCYIGRFRQYNDRYFHSKADLLAEMDHFGIAEALVCDTLSRELDPRAGNPRILEFCNDEPRLKPSWALAPPLQALPFPVDELLCRMAEADVRAVRLFPGQLCFSMEEWCIGPILEVLEEGRVPVFVDYSPALDYTTPDQTDWDALVRLCNRYPQLPVIATEGRMYWEDRTWYSALGECDNLHIEISPLWAYNGIEFVCREYGAQHLLFGTRLPVRDAGCTTAYLQYADVTAEEKWAIAGDNLRRLLAGALPKAEPAPRPKRIDLPAPDPAQGKLYLAIREEQQPFAGEVLIDIHSHIGYGAPYFMPEQEPADLVRQLKRYGFQKLITFAFGGFQSDWVWANNFAGQAMGQFPDTILPLAAVNLCDEAEMIAEIERCCDELGFWGVKLHPSFNGYPQTGPNVRRACEMVNERGLIIENHNWGAAEWLDELAGEFPKAHFIEGHMMSADDAFAAVINRHENVAVCTCLPICRGVMEELVGRVDENRIMFGSDVPDLPIPLGFGPILYARIGDEAKRKIMGLNAQRMLERVAANRR